MAMSPTLLPIQAQQHAMLPQMPPQQQAPGLNNGTAPGGVASMVKALFDGNNQYNQRKAGLQQLTGAQPFNPDTATGGPSVPAQSVVPNSDGLLGVQVPMNPAPGLPGMPNGIDPSMQGLFSRIPGEGSQYGG